MQIRERFIMEMNLLRFSIKKLGKIILKRMKNGKLRIIPGKLTNPKTTAFDNFSNNRVPLSTSICSTVSKKIATVDNSRSISTISKHLKRDMSVLWTPPP
jgi:hypothetical protein